MPAVDKVLEQEITFHEKLARAARLLLDASYKAAGNGEDEVTIRLMRIAVEKMFGTSHWEVMPPAKLDLMPWDTDNSADSD